MTNKWHQIWTVGDWVVSKERVGLAKLLIGNGCQRHQLELKVITLNSIIGERAVQAHCLVLSIEICDSDQFTQKGSPHQILFLLTCRLCDVESDSMSSLWTINKTTCYCNFVSIILRNYCLSVNTLSFSPCLPWCVVWLLSIERTCSTARNKRESGILGLLKGHAAQLRTREKVEFLGCWRFTRGEEFIAMLRGQRLAAVWPATMEAISPLLAT
jgi:hypothetical protein